MTFVLPQEKEEQQLRDLVFLKSAVWLILLLGFAAVLLNTSTLGLFGGAAAL